MRDQLKNNVDQIGMIAIYLSNIFLKPLYKHYHERSYFGYVACLEQILDWSEEFYSDHYHLVQDKELPEINNDRILGDSNVKDYLLEWGNKKISEFIAVHRNEIKHVPSNASQTDGYGELLNHLL